MSRLNVVCLVTIGLAAPVLAQDKKVELNLGGGATFPSRTSRRLQYRRQLRPRRDRLDDPTIGFQAQYTYTRMNRPEKTITVTPTPIAGVGSAQSIQSNQQVNAGVFDIIGARTIPIAWRTATSSADSGSITASSS